VRLRPRPLGECGHDFFVAFSCKLRCICPSCHTKRELLWAELLPQGYYNIHLSGVSASGELNLVDTYYFQVAAE